jgi:hypothetical protein
MQYTVYGIQYTVYSIRYTVYTVYGYGKTVYGIRYTVYGIRYTVYGIRYTDGMRYTVYGIRTTNSRLRFSVFFRRGEDDPFSRARGFLISRSVRSCFLNPLSAVKSFILYLISIYITLNILTYLVALQLL